MLRLALLAAALPLFGCASARTDALVVDDALDGYVVKVADAEPVAEPVASPSSWGFEMPSAAASEASPWSATPEPASLAALPVLEDESLHGSRFTIKGGLYSSSEDALDDGFIVNLSWMRFFSKLFALEFEAGYVDADGSDSGIDTDLWAIPLMVNGRLNLPIWVLDVYGGLGVGGFYYDIDSDLDDDDGFLLGGNAFLGATINVGDAMALGLEGKYYVTDEISDFDESLDAFALMLTLGFSR